MGLQDLHPAHELSAILWRYLSQLRQQRPHLPLALACLESAVELLTPAAAAVAPDVQLQLGAMLTALPLEAAAAAAAATDVAVNFPAEPVSLSDCAAVDLAPKKVAAAADQAGHMCVQQ